MKKYILGITIVLVAIISITVNNKTAEANPSFWKSANHATSTSVTSYMTPGTGTTTVVLNDLTDGGTYASDKAVLAIQMTATSTTNSTEPFVRIRIEGSMDGNTWYAQSGLLNSTGTTTVYSSINGEYQISFASSTANLGASGTTTRMNQSFPIDTPMTYTRAVLYSPPLSGNFAIWADIISKRQIR